MPAAQAAVVARVEEFKTEIGWSWNEICVRLRWSPGQLKQFRDMKAGIDDDSYRYLEEVSQAVKSVRGPGNPTDAAVSFASDMPLMPRVPVSPSDTRAAPNDPGETITRVRVMTLEDIARKLAEEYAAVIDEPSISTIEIASARWAISRMAEKFNVVAEVKAIVEQGRQAPLAPAPAMVDAGRSPSPPIPHRATVSRALPAGDTEEYVPPTRQAQERTPFEFGEA